MEMTRLGKYFAENKKEFSGFPQTAKAKHAFKHFKAHYFGEKGVKGVSDHTGSIISRGLATVGKKRKQASKMLYNLRKNVSEKANSIRKDAARARKKGKQKIADYKARKIKQKLNSAEAQTTRITLKRAKFFGKKAGVNVQKGKHSIFYPSERNIFLKSAGKKTSLLAAAHEGIFKGGGHGAQRKMGLFGKRRVKTEMDAWRTGAKAAKKRKFTFNSRDSRFVNKGLATYLGKDNDPSKLPKSNHKFFQRGGLKRHIESGGVLNGNLMEMITMGKFRSTPGKASSKLANRLMRAHATADKKFDTYFHFDVDHPTGKARKTRTKFLNNSYNRNSRLGDIIRRRERRGKPAPDIKALFSWGDIAHSTPRRPLRLGRLRR